MKYLLLALAATFASPILGQDLTIKVAKHLNYRQPATPTLIDHGSYALFYANKDRAYNIKGIAIAKMSHPIRSIKVNPASNNYALLSSKQPVGSPYTKNKTAVNLFSPFYGDKLLHEFQPAAVPTAIAYASDAKTFYIATAAPALEAYDLRNYARLNTLSLPFAPTALAISSNDYYVAAAADHKVIILNPLTGRQRTTLTLPATIIALQFNNDASQLGVLTDDGHITLYPTQTFEAAQVISGVNGAHDFAFHPEGKYIATAHGAEGIRMINIFQPNERATLMEPEGAVDHLTFVHDEKHRFYLAYTAPNSLKYKLLEGLSPNYGRQLRDELNARLDAWSKMRPDETEEEYRLRVNDESRLQQTKRFEEEIATRMADDLAAKATVTLGGYNTESGMLTLAFDNMPSIYLPVPQNEVADFMNGNDLKISDAVYGLTSDDRFELIYAEVHNSANGKTYTFNNKARKSLNYLESQSDFVPIELVRQSGMEEAKLSRIADDVVKKAKSQQLISDHTNIEVRTEVVSDVDADGRKVTNYKVGFKYTVAGDYSIKEDFPAGAYLLSDSHAATSMLDIACQAFASDFAAYLQPGKKVLISITGSADALPIRGNISYDGRFGEFHEEPYLLDGSLTTMTLTSQEGIRSNEALAFMRAIGVKEYISHAIKPLSLMLTDYRLAVKLLPETGGAYRRIEVDFTFIDAF